MGSTTSESMAVSYQDYNGKRYYFCCGDCPEKFKAEPSKYEDGKALKSAPKSM
jgi:YHS domain-containing protein